METLSDSLLPCVLSLPTAVPVAGAPLLCFLHGYGEAAPASFPAALTRHGPLHPANAALAARFLVVAPQLPTAGDLWHRFAADVAEIVLRIQGEYGTDPRYVCLTGFSFGGNGVFDLGLEQPSLWTSLWAVDPTRLPPRDPEQPVWLSVGEVSRRLRPLFVSKLALEEADGDPDRRRVWLDQGADHVGSARLAYGDARIYDWLVRYPRP